MLGAADKERSEAEQAGAPEAGVGWVEVPGLPAQPGTLLQRGQTSWGSN